MRMSEQQMERRTKVFNNVGQPSEKRLLAGEYKCIGEFTNAFVQFTTDPSNQGAKPLHLEQLLGFLRKPLLTFLKNFTFLLLQKLSRRICGVGTSLKHGAAFRQVFDIYRG
eukprot:g43596.t1